MNNNDKHLIYRTPPLKERVPRKLGFFPAPKQLYILTPSFASRQNVTEFLGNWECRLLPSIPHRGSQKQAKVSRQVLEEQNRVRAFFISNLSRWQQDKHDTFP